jgi:hypothetical protein
MSGTPGNAVSPADPKQADEADTANPGEMTQMKSDSVEVKPHKPPQTKEERAEKKSWIEIVLVDVEDMPVPGEPYRITLPDATVAEGTLDNKGFARVEGFDPGQCKVTFPKRDQTVWHPK